MSMMDAQRRISRKTFFSTDRLGEEVLYNGKPLVALVYIGASLARSDWNDAATSIENASLADIAVFSICDDPDDGGVDHVDEGDSIVYKGHEYSVAQVIQHDMAGSHYVVLATKGELGWGNK